MAQHDVNFTVPKRPVGKADIEFEVKRGGTKFGTLKVSKGSLVWVTADHTYGYKLSWRAFADLASEHGRKGHK